jgi:hypothetical protein
MEKQRRCPGPFLRRVPGATHGERIVAAMQQATAALGGRTHDVAGCVLVETTDERTFRVRGGWSGQEPLDAFWRVP